MTASAKGAPASAPRKLSLPDIAPIILFCMSASVLFGWYTHNERLIQIAPDLAPMPYNTALAFALSAIGLYAANHSRRKVVWVAAGLVFAIGALTLLEYATGINLFIDALLMDAYFATQTSHPGRMAPNTALCFVLTACFLAISIRPRNWNKDRLAEQILAFAILALAIIPFVTYLRDVETAHGWGGLTRMAPHTAISFIVIAFAFVFFFWREKSSNNGAIAFGVVAGMAIGALILDLNTPLGFAAGSVYLPLILCSIFLARPTAPFVIAAFSSALIVVGFFASPQSDTHSGAVVANRAVSIGVIWVAAFLVFLHRNASDRSRAADKRLGLILDNAGEGVFGVDLDGKTNFINSAASKMLGYAADELLGVNQHDLVHCKHDDGSPCPDEQCPIYEAFRNGNTHAKDNEVFWRKDGSSFSVEYVSTPIRNEDGALQGAVVVFRDVTERKRLEREREQLLTNYIAINHELENFARVAAHDLQEPLRKMMIYSDMLPTSLGNDLPPNAKADLKVIHDSAHRMQRLVKDTLSIAQLSGQVVELSPCDPNRAIDSALQNLAQRIDDVNAKVVRDELPAVLGEKTLLVQVYQNLISNALKFISPERQPEIRLTASDEGDQIVLGVCDNGIGIEDHYREKIFQPLMRVHSRERYTGNGIGLAICKHAVERMNGRIWVEDAPQAGTHFRFAINKADKIALRNAS